MRFYFKAQDSLLNVSYVCVSETSITYATDKAIPCSVSNFARDAVALKAKLRSMYESTKPAAEKAQAMLDAIRAACSFHRCLTWTIDDSTMEELRNAPTGPTLDTDHAIKLIDRLVMVIGTHAPHLMTCDVDVQEAHALLVKHGRWAPPPPPAKATRVRRPRKAHAA